MNLLLATAQLTPATLNVTETCVRAPPFPPLLQNGSRVSLQAAAACWKAPAVQFDGSDPGFTMAAKSLMIEGPVLDPQQPVEERNWVRKAQAAV